MNILVVMALQIEAENHFNDIDILFTGVGKVNATYSLTQQIAKCRPDVVINLGSAGGITVKSGNIVCCRSFIQRDMHVTPLGFEPYQTPFENEIMLNNGLNIEGYNSSICATGDSFVNCAPENSNFDVVDMEAYALAKVCQIQNIPFYCAKYISDNANENSATDWQPSLNDGAQKMRKIYDAIIQSI